jgi:magnesium transporter
MSDNVQTDYYSQEDILLPLLAALKEEAFKSLAKMLEKQHPADIAELLNLSEHSDRERIIHLLGDVDSEILTYLDPQIKEEVASLLGAKTSAEALDELESDEAVSFVEDLPEEKRDEILEELSTEKRLEVEDALTYPADSAGRLANKDFVTIPKKADVGDVIDFLRTEDDLPNDFYTIFVIDDEGRPTHFVPLSRIMRNKRDKKIKDLMAEVKYPIPGSVDQEEVANIFKKYNLISTPVVDPEGKMIGVITVDDIAYVIEEEAQEDMLKLAGMSSDTDILSSPYKRFKDRAPWLMINLFAAILSTFIISNFEQVIGKIVALAALMPVVSALSGNVGTQALTVTVRAIASQELNFMNYIKVLRKEIFAAILNGLLVGLAAFFVSYLIFGNQNLSLIMYSAVVVTFIVGVFLGSLVPLLMQKFGFDPAVASPVFVTASTDVVSFLFFLGIATLYLL